MCIKKVLSLSNKVICGDCSVVLKGIPSNSIDCVITSPPYFNQREYNGVGIGGESKYKDYLESLLEVFDELVRIIKTTGSILYNIGDKIDKRKGTMLIPYRFAIEAMKRNVKLINNITWVKSNPTPRQYNRRLVSATEPFFHFVKSDKYYYNLDKFAINNKAIKYTPSHKLGKKYFELIEKSTLSLKQKQKAVNDINKVIKEVYAGEITGFRVKIKGVHAPAFGGQDGGRKNQIDKNGYTIIKLKGKNLHKDYIETAVESLRLKVKHPAVYPLPLIEQLVRLVCPENGIVLDPYSGSGTTLVASKKQNRSYLGIDISPQYCCLAQERLLL